LLEELEGVEIEEGFEEQGGITVSIGLYLDSQNCFIVF
jgi:hypothetical protein